MGVYCSETIITYCAHNSVGHQFWQGTAGMDYSCFTKSWILDWGGLNSWRCLRAPQGSYTSGASVRLLAGFFGSSSRALCWDCSVLQGVFTHISASEGWNSLGTASIALSTLSPNASFQQGSLRVVDLLLTRQLRTPRVSAPRE